MSNISNKENENIERFEYLTFDVNGTKFAINSGYIDNITNIENITKVPNENNSIDGIVVIRGQTVVIVNLGEYLFKQKIDMNEHTICVVCKVGDTKVALRVSGVQGIVNVTSKELFDVGPMLRNSCYMIEGIIADREKDITQILDIKQIINDVGQ